MRLKIVSLQKTVGAFLKSRNYATKPAHCDAHMNELPVPCGSWDIDYKERQSYYTQTLVAGAAWWLFSLVMMFYTDSVYFNWGPPPQPGPPSDMIEECDDSDT